MSNKLFTLRDIFKDRIFRIPDFQRGYSWNKSQLEDLWEDLQNLDETRKHYTGMLTVEPVNDVGGDRWKNDQWLIERGDKPFYVIDGQQRLTTLIILLNELLKGEGNINSKSKEYWKELFLYERLDDTHNSFKFGYETDNPSDEFFKTKVLEQYSYSADKYSENLYTLNLSNAKKFFSDKLKSFDEQEKQVLFKKLVNQLTFNYYEIENPTDVFVTFETMNNRGKQLSVFELLKNRLIYLSTIIPNSSDVQRYDLRKEINDVWATVYEYLGKNPQNPLDEDAFLKNHWIMYYSYSRDKANVFIDFLLKEEFTVKHVLNTEPPLTSSDIIEYIMSLQKCVKTWFYMENVEKSPYSEEIKIWIVRMHRLGWRGFQPLTMGILTRLEANQEDFNTVLEYMKVMERFCFMANNISALRTDAKNSIIYGFANSYHKHKKEEKHLKDIIRGIKDLTNDNIKVNLFENNMRYSLNKDTGFFDWTGLRYFLYEYEQYLQEQAKGVSKVSWQDITYETIEHIYPQTATDDYWTSRFDDESSAFYLNSLGNLLLLSRAKNSKLGNADFETKKKRTDSSGYFNGSYSEIEVAQYPEWTKETIIERGKKMLAFMQQRWNFTIEKPDSLLRPQEESNNNQTKD